MSYEEFPSPDLRARLASYGEVARQSRAAGRPDISAASHEEIDLMLDVLADRGDLEG